MECWFLVLWFGDYLLGDLVGSFWTLQWFGHIAGLKLRLNNVQGVTTCLGTVVTRSIGFEVAAAASRLMIQGTDAVCEDYSAIALNAISGNV